MIVGVAREVRYQEYRVGLTPAGAARLVRDGHEVVIAAGAGRAAGFGDDEYVAAGARVVLLNEDLFQQCDLLVKFHAPTEGEIPFLREGQILFASIHLATQPDLARALLDRKVTAISYETVALGDRLPIVRPMSEIAGRMAVQVGSQLLFKAAGGKGVLLGGVTGVPVGTVTILGAGTVGTHAARVADGMGGRVFVLDVDLDRLARIDEIFGGRVNTIYADSSTVDQYVRSADLLIGAVQDPGRRTPVVVPADLVARMEPGSVIVDVSVDQGGCVETIRPTTHGNPTYVHEGVVHYGVPNMPGAVARTSTLALTNVTIGYVVRLANLGLAAAVRSDASLAAGLNTHAGSMVHRTVAEALGLRAEPMDWVLD